MDLEEIVTNSENWVDSAQDRDYWRALVNATLNLRVAKAMELIIIVNQLIGLGSAYLTADHEVAGSIPGTSTI